MKKTEELKELRELDAGGLRDRVNSLKEELMKLRFRLASGQLETTAQLTTIKRKIARTNTILNGLSKAATR